MTTGSQSHPDAPLQLSWGPLLEQHPLAHFVYDVATLELLAVNAAALARYACTRDEFLSLKRSDFLMPGELDRLQACLAQPKHGELERQPSVWLETDRAGRVLHADICGLNVLWQGRPARLCAITDAGQRQRLQADLAQSQDWHQRLDQSLPPAQAWLQGLLAALPDLWMVFDAEQRYAEVSDTRHPSLSAPWDQKLGRRLVDVQLPQIALAALAHMAQAHASGQAQAHRYDLQVMDGRTLSFESRYVALDGGRTLALIRDVTETRMLEHRFQSMADGAPIGIYLTDAMGACTYTNAAWQALYGLDATQSLGHGWSATVSAEDRIQVVSAWRHHTQLKQSFDMEFRVQPVGQAMRTVWSRSSPILAPDGSVLAHVGAVVDVTQARELQAERQARAVAEEAGQRQTAFISRVSHELRTPLNAILGFGELLHRDPAVATSPSGSYAAHVLQAGRHMLALVDDLLELQRLQQDQRQPDRAPVLLHDLLQASRQMLQPMADAAGVSMAVSCPVALSVHSDERCLRQILLNLGSNAVKYGGRGSTLCLSAQRLADRVLISVSDNGPGLTAEQQLRLFKPFDRLGQDRNGVPGSGLGLVITRQLALALGGELTLVSQPGAGAQVVLSLPVPAA